MPTVVVPLKEMVIDPEKDVDLLTLPETEAIALIKKAYGFLSSAIEVSIKDGVASIVLSDENKERVDMALKSYERGLKHAKQGEYKRAIPLFQRALEALPDHTDARRNMAMAYLEAGDKEKAKDLLIQTLALDPKDTWAYVLLGNIYSKHEDKWDKAERLYNRAYELNPKDAVLLTNYGALMAERKNYEQASEFFERAIQANPTFPNSYYALALLDLQQDHPESAVKHLDDLFAKAYPDDARAASLYAQARQLYLDTNTRVAETAYDRAMEFIAERQRALADQTGYPIETVADETLQDASAVTQMAWTHHRERHLLKYRQTNHAIIPHLLAHELEHIALEYRARQAGRARTFVTTARSREHAIRSIGDYVYAMKKRGYVESDISAVVQQMIEGLCNQLFNLPLDMVIESRVHQNDVSVRPIQFVSLHSTCLSVLPVLTNRELARGTPPQYT